MEDFLKEYDKRNLSQGDYESIGKFLIVYSEHIEPYYSSFRWDDITFKNYCESNKIVAKGNKNKGQQHNHFWFTAKTPKNQSTQDYAHHFLRHIRNAFAHGNFYGEYIGKGQKDINTLN